MRKETPISFVIRSFTRAFGPRPSVPASVEPGDSPTWRDRQKLVSDGLAWIAPRTGIKTMKMLLCAATAAALVHPARSDVWSPAADFIVTGASILTMGPSPHAEALAVKDGKIIGVGTTDEVMTLRGPHTEMVDAAGKSIIPGLQDSHIHPLSLGRDVQLQAELISAGSAAEVVASLVDLKSRVDPKKGAWMVGARWDASQFDTLFTRWDLDPESPDNPVYLKRYRGLGVNTAVFALMGIKEDDPSTWPSWWLEDPEGFTAEDTIYRSSRSLKIDGETREYNIPTGVFIGSKAVALVTVAPPKPTFEDDVESVRLGSIELLKVGITSVIDAANHMGYNTKIYQAARDRSLLGVKMPASYTGIFYTQTPEEISDVLGGLQVSNLGDPWLRLRGVKVYSDGGPSARGSWLGEAYEPAHVHETGHEAKDFGVPVMEDYSKREAQFRAILNHGWDLHTHATGDAAMLQVARLYRELQDEIRAKNPEVDLRWSIEHANLPLENSEILDIMVKYKIIASVQPIMISELGNAWIKNIGPERMARSIPVRSYMKHGVVVVAGSDYGVTPYDPWLGMYAMVTRKDKNTGTIYGPDETISLRDAMKTYTINGAFATYEEKTKGSLEVGKTADFVILDIADLFEAERNPELLLTMKNRVLATVVDGIVRYQRKGANIFE